MLTNLLVLIFGFTILWIGSGVVVNSVNHFSKKLSISSFAFSFFILGLLTSIPEFAVGFTSVVEKKPEVFIGNLIGGVPVIFLLIIPILAILGNGISFKNKLSDKNLIFSFVVMLAPAFFILNKSVNMLESIIMVFLYVILFFFIERNNGILNTKNSEIMNIKNYSYKDLVKILTGAVLAFIGSHFILNTTLYFAGLLNVSPFIISLVFLSLGTNIPELSLAVRSVISGAKDVAFGDYVGSAAANTLLFGIFGLMYGKIILENTSYRVFIFITLGLALFYLFTRSKNNISRNEGIILILIYLIFIAIGFISV